MVRARQDLLQLEAWRAAGKTWHRFNGLPCVRPSCGTCGWREPFLSLLCACVAPIRQVCLCLDGVGWGGYPAHGRDAVLLTDLAMTMRMLSCAFLLVCAQAHAKDPFVFNVVTNRRAYFFQANGEVGVAGVAAPAWMRRMDAAADVLAHCTACQCP